MNSDPRGDGPLKAALFDLDGTLLDTRAGILGALDAAMTEATGSPPPNGAVDFSLALDEMIARAAHEMPAELRRRVAAAFRHHYDERYWADATLLPGATACLRELHAEGLRLFVVTNKRVTATARLLEGFGLMPLIEAFFAQPDASPPIPKEALVERCLVAGGLLPAEAVFIGDSDEDARAAARRDVAFVAVTSGAGPLGHMRDDPPRVEVASLADAAASVLAMRPGRKP